MLQPLIGHQREEGKKADRKQHGDEWWKRRETPQAGKHGVLYAMQLHTEHSVRETSKPCVPPGTERFKVKVKVRLASRVNQNSMITILVHSFIL